MGRGDRMEIGTFIEQSVDHELSGNIIDLCPVGALNNKPYRFSARAWEMEQRATIAPHDCIGSNIFAHVLRGRLKRVVPQDNDAINETWLSDRDRFSYEGIYSEDRLLEPLVRIDGKHWRLAAFFPCQPFWKRFAVWVIRVVFRPVAGVIIVMGHLDAQCRRCNRMQRRGVRGAEVVALHKVFGQRLPIARPDRLLAKDKVAVFHFVIFDDRHQALKLVG